MKKIILAVLLAFIAALGFYSPSFAQQTNVRVVTACGALSPYGAIGAGAPYSMTMDTNGNLCTAASVTASISGFTATSTGTPISVTTASTTGTLPAGAVVVATNVGSTNGVFCALGGTATTSNQYLSPGGGWFAFTVGASTQLSCITSTGTTTVNMTGGAGLPTGTGGGGGGGSGGTVSQGPGNPANPWTITPLTGSTFGVFPSGTFAVSTNIDQGTTSVAIDSSTAGTAQLIAAPGSGALYITQWWVSAPSGTFKLVYGTGSNCATGTTELFGPLTMNGGQSGAGGGAGSILFVPAGNALCTVLSASVQYSGSVSYLNR